LDVPVKPDPRDRSKLKADAFTKTDGMERKTSDRLRSWPSGFLTKYI
jgi:hypothetical protein